MYYSITFQENRGLNKKNHPKKHIGYSQVLDGLSHSISPFHKSHNITVSVAFGFVNIGKHSYIDIVLRSNNDFQKNGFTKPWRN